MGMDWVPCFGWGVEQTIGPNVQGEQPLMDIVDQYNVGDIVGLIEPSQIRYFVHRIVGQFSAHFIATPASLNVSHFRIWPAWIDTTGAPQVVTADFLDEADGANARIWFERKMRLGQALNEILDPTATGVHPWWSNVDITPKQVIEKYHVLTFSVFNDEGTASMRFRHWFRMLVTPLD